MECLVHSLCVQTARVAVLQRWEDHKQDPASTRPCNTIGATLSDSMSYHIIYHVSYVHIHMFTYHKPKQRFLNHPNCCLLMDSVQFPKIPFDLAGEIIGSFDSPILCFPFWSKSVGATVDSPKMNWWTCTNFTR